MKVKYPDEYIITIKSWSLKDHKSLKNEKTNAKELVDLRNRGDVVSPKQFILNV